jgi:cytochrome P450
MLSGVGDATAIETIDSVNDQLITELLRVDGPAQAVTRTATRNHVFGDVTVHTGEPALVVRPDHHYSYGRNERTRTWARIR